MGVDLSKIGVPTMAEINARPRATPKYAMKTRLDEKDDKDKTDEKQLAQWRADVRRLDKARKKVTFSERPAA